MVDADVMWGNILAEVRRVAAAAEAFMRKTGDDAPLSFHTVGCCASCGAMVQGLLRVPPTIDNVRKAAASAFKIVAGGIAVTMETPCPRCCRATLMPLGYAVGCVGQTVTAKCEKQTAAPQTEEPREVYCVAVNTIFGRKAMVVFGIRREPRVSFGEPRVMAGGEKDRLGGPFYVELPQADISGLKIGADEERPNYIY